MTEYLCENGRDHALMCIGMFSVGGTSRDSKVKAGYAPAFEGPTQFRSLPFVQAFGVRIYYKEK